MVLQKNINTSTFLVLSCSIVNSTSSTLNIFVFFPISGSLLRTKDFIGAGVTVIAGSFEM
jgi:hypothetical protein